MNWYIPWNYFHIQGATGVELLAQNLHSMMSTLVSFHESQCVAVDMTQLEFVANIFNAEFFSPSFFTWLCVKKKNDGKLCADQQLNGLWSEKENIH